MALPAVPNDTCDRLRAAADRLVCLRTPDLFFAIGTWYLDFGQVADDDIRALLTTGSRVIPNALPTGRRKIDHPLVRAGGL